MFKRAILATVLLASAGSAHAAFLPGLMHGVYSVGDTIADGTEQAVHWAMERGTHVLIVAGCAIGSSAIDLAGGLDQINADLPGMNDAESKVFMEYVDNRKEHFCNDPADLIRIVRELKSTLDPDKARAAAIANLPQYTLNTDGDTVVDAFRHARGTAIATRILGDTWGKKLMEAHESDTDGVPGDNKAPAHLMDLHNNDVGYLAFQDLYGKLGRDPSNGEIEANLRSRCYHFVDRDEEFTAFGRDVGANPGLVYILKANVPVEENGVNCAIPRVNRALSFVPVETRIPNDNPVNISGVGSQAPVGGSISAYKWTFPRPVTFCSPETGCYQTTTVNGTTNGEFINTYRGKVYLMDRSPMNVSLEAANAYGEWSNASKAWINNWGPMVPIIQLVLN